MGDGSGVVGDLPAVLHGRVEKAIVLQHSAVVAYVQRLRRARPTATPAEILATLEKRYLATVTGAGAVLGGAAATPGAGTGLALALSGGEMAVFLETTALFTLAVAEVHAVRVDDARALVLTVVLENGGTMLVEKTAGRGGDRWGKLLIDLIPMSSISAINKALCHWFMNQYPRNQGVMVLGKILPFGIGAGLAAVGNHSFGRIVVSACRRVFGPPPAGFPEAATVVDTVSIPLDAAVPSPRTEAATNEQPAPAPEPSNLAPEQPDPVPVTGKYRPLFDHLVAQDIDRVELSFTDIDALVPGRLPKSASTGKAWWGNSPSSRQAKAWLAAGFDVTAVDLESKKVQFTKRDHA